MTKTCIIVSHTHWDREWYETFQHFRLRLVRLVDKLLHILETDPAYRHFMLDGQTIVLEDYLQIRPEREGNLRRFVHDGRLLIGPWHVLPDEFLVSGESIVRNLLLGDRVARRFGPKMMIGYIPDPFGHISQLPQILRGFGMDSTAMRRGLDDHPTELLWQAPDGSTVLLCYLRDGYDNAARLPVHDTRAFVAESKRLHDSLAPFAPTDHVLLMNGVDHMEPVPELPQAIAAAAQLAPDLHLVHGTLPMYVDAVKSSLSLDMVQENLGPPKLQTIRGELRSPKRHHLLPGVLSARMWIKQRNARIQTLLEKWAEPFAALADVVVHRGRPSTSPSSALIWQAWKYLLENHPHDSICGCSIDQVHREMVTRFDWAEQIGEEVTRQSLATIAAHVNTASAALPRPCLPVVVFNALAAARTDVVTASVQVPGSLESFVVVDAQGHIVPHMAQKQAGQDFASLELRRDEIMGMMSMVEMVATLGLSVQEIDIVAQGTCATVDVTLMEGGRTDSALLADAQRQVEELLASGVQRFRMHAHHAATISLRFVAQDVPGCGHKTYFLTRGETTAVHIGAPPTKVDATTPTLHLENEYLSVDINPQDATLTLLDKSTGAVFPGLHRFIDGGDRGDEYNYCAPELDHLVTAPSAPPHITWLNRGSAGSTIEIQQLYQAPAQLSRDRSTRSQEMVDVPITTRISLFPGVRRLDLCTEIDNRARDHRLRVHFPTPIRTDYSEAESTFDVVRRPLRLPTDTSEWVEQPVPTHPQQTFVDISNGSIGLMVINRGLPEFEALHEVDGKVTIALTLLRCIGWLSRDDFPCREGHAGPALETPEAQCQGRHVFEYAIVPHAGNWQAAYQEAHAFNAPLRAIHTGRHDGLLPPSESLISLRGEGMVLSTVKAAESGEGLIVRFYNILGKAAIASLHAAVPIRSARLVNLAEEEIQPLVVDGPGVVRVALKGKQIATVKLLF